MSLNSILAIAQSVSINDHRFVGQVLSRNQMVTVGQIQTRVPFQFTFKPHDYLLYSQNRSLLQNLRYADKTYEQVLNFGSTGWVNYIKYQGDMTSVQISSVTITGTTGAAYVTLGSLPSISSGAYIVRAGDFLQYGRSVYIATADVTRGGGATVTVPIHRSVAKDSYTTTTIPLVVGEYGITRFIGNGYAYAQYTGVSFPVILREYPSYSLIPMTNDSFIQWNGDFTAMENNI